DYIKKPYTLNVLLAKVKAVLARYERAGSGTVQAAAVPFTGTITEDIRLDTNTHKLDVRGELVSLKAMEYKMLLYLLENRGRVVTKDELLKNVWDDEFVGEGTLAVHIRHLREKIETDPKNPEVIKTIWGVGYMVEEL
ncbi:MAG: response regulator transcription factor, partial [Clostridiales bacterium]|nr:response regulator transcription factor [Clostridiales bacterium]